MVDSTWRGWLLLAVLLTGSIAVAQPAKKKAAPAAKKKGKAAAPATPAGSSDSAGGATAPAQEELAPLVPASDLKAAPPPAEPAPVHTIVANPDLPPRPVEPAPVAAAPAVVLPAALNRAWLEAWGGVAVPTAVLGVGPAAGLAFELRPWRDAPLRAALRVGFERHLGRGPGLFLSTPQPRGFDPAVGETQLVVPIELGAVWEVVHPGNGALLVGASYSLLPTVSQTLALGAARSETGLGHGVTFELGYGHRFGDVELSLRARWGLRTTSVGPVSAVLEQSWYQVAGGVLTVGYCL